MPRKSDAERKKIVEEVEKRIAEKSLTIKEACAALDISRSSFYRWRKMYGNTDNDRGGESELNVEKLIVDLKKEHPYYGQQKIIKQLERSHGVDIKRSQVVEILEKHGLKETAAHKKQKKGKRRFERVEPLDLAQMDVMYYTLRHNRRLYLITVLDDHSRFVLAHKVSTSQTADKAIDTLKMAVEKHGIPQQVLTDRGSQFHAWQGMSRFDEFLDKMGIDHLLTKPQSPQTIGKIESWHRNIQRELFNIKDFGSVEAARDGVNEYVEFYNHERVHMGLDYATPADRFFGVDDDLKRVLKKEPGFYLTARIDGQPLRACEVAEDRAQVKLAGKEIKELDISAIKELLL